MDTATATKLDDAGWESALGIGHNGGPAMTPFAALKAQADERIDTANRWITERPTITDAAMAEKATGFRDQLAATYKATEAQRKADKEPHMLAAKAVDAQYAPVLSLLESAGKAIKAKITDYLVAEQAKADAERRAREAEARRKADEAAAAQRRAEEEARKAGGDALRSQAAAEASARAAADAAKAAAEPARATIKGDYNARAVSLRSTWTAEMIDEAAAWKHYQKNPAVRAAALAKALELATADAKAFKDAERAPPGFRFVETKTAV